MSFIMTMCRIPNRVMHLLWNVFVGYAFQPVEKFMAMLFNLLKKIWLCFSTSEKLYSMNFRYLKSLVQWFSEPEKSKNP